MPFTLPFATVLNKHVRNWREEVTWKALLLKKAPGRLFLDPGDAGSMPLLTFLRPYG